MGQVAADDAMLELLRSLCSRLRAAGQRDALAAALNTLSSHLRLGPYRAEARAVAEELQEIAALDGGATLQTLALRALHHALFVEASPIAERYACTDRLRELTDSGSDLFSYSLIHLNEINDARLALAAGGDGGSGSMCHSWQRRGMQRVSRIADAICRSRWGRRRGLGGQSWPDGATVGGAPEPRWEPR